MLLRSHSGNREAGGKKKEAGGDFWKRKKSHKVQSGASVMSHVHRAEDGELQGQTNGKCTQTIKTIITITYIKLLSN